MLVSRLRRVNYPSVKKGEVQVACIVKINQAIGQALAGPEPLLLVRFWSNQVGYLFGATTADT